MIGAGARCFPDLFYLLDVPLQAFRGGMRNYLFDNNDRRAALRFAPAFDPLDAGDRSAGGIEDHQPQVRGKGSSALLR